MSDILHAFQKNEAAIRRYVSRLLPKNSDIEDIMQETFLKGFAAELNYSISEPKAYLFKIARNVVLTNLRKKHQSLVEPLGDTRDEGVLVDEGQVGADDQLEGRQKMALFTRAIAHLPPRCQKVFILRHIEGLQYKQIASRMDISTKAVEYHLTTGLLKCRAYLKEHGVETAVKNNSQSERTHIENLPQNMAVTKF